MKECDVKGGIYLPNTIDEFGYVQWQPVLQTQPVDFAQLESELGFKIHKSIKEFHSITGLNELNAYLVAEIICG